VVDSFATGASLAFLLLIAWPTYEFARDELAITTPALQITDAWRAAALPAGIAFMIGFALLRLTRAAPIKAVALSLGLVALFVGLFWLSAPLLRQLGNLELLIFLSAWLPLRFWPACRSHSLLAWRSSAIWDWQPTRR